MENQTINETTNEQVTSVNADGVTGDAPVVTVSKRRRSVSLGLRFKVLNRDSFRCRYCGATAATAVLQVDHVIPVARGGRDEEENLVTACQDCNLGKSDRPLTPPRGPQPAPGIGIRISPEFEPIEVPPVTYWRGQRWKVTSQGIDTIDDAYFIAAHRIWEDDNGYGWVEHMRTKNSGYLWEFVEALEFARRLFVFSPAGVSGVSGGE